MEHIVLFNIMLIQVKSCLFLSSIGMPTLETRDLDTFVTFGARKRLDF